MKSANDALHKEESRLSGSCAELKTQHAHVTEPPTKCQSELDESRQLGLAKDQALAELKSPNERLEQQLLGVTTSRSALEAELANAGDQLTNC
jgi:chromosome segregation ATPase